MLLLFLFLLGGIIIKKINLKPITFILILYGIVLSLINKRFNDNIFTNEVTYWSSIHPKNILLYFIPPLIFHASNNLDIHIFKKTFLLILLMSFTSIIINTSLLSILIYFLDNTFHNKYCILVGCILSAIDPVSINSILEEIQLSDKLFNLIETESLFNDEVTIILLYGIISVFSENYTANSILIQTGKLLFGSIFIGSTLTFLVIFSLKYLHGDFFSESTLTICGYYLAYYLSERTILDASGILSVFIYGLLMAGFGKTRICPDNLTKVKYIWDLLYQYCNIIIFILSSLISSDRIYGCYSDYRNWINLFVLYISINAIRFFYCLIFYPILRKNVLHYDYVDFLIIALSGIRGEISLLLSLIVDSLNIVDDKTSKHILFYVFGITFLTISINTNLIRLVIILFHRNKIKMDRHQLSLLNNQLVLEGEKYLDRVSKNEFHLSKVNFVKVNGLFLNRIDINEIIISEDEPDKIVINEFLNALKKSIWNLFQCHELSYSVVMKLTDIIDDDLDFPNRQWGMFMYNYCKDEHVYTYFICFLGKIPILKYFMNYLIRYRIEYNYNLVLGYIISIKKTQNMFSELLTDIEMNQLNKDIRERLDVYHSYIELLEEKYSDILIEIETKQMCLLVLSKMKEQLGELKKNGEMNDRFYRKLYRRLMKKQYKITHNYEL